MSKQKKQDAEEIVVANESIDNNTLVWWNMERSSEKTESSQETADSQSEMELSPQKIEECFTTIDNLGHYVQEAKEAAEKARDSAESAGAVELHWYKIGDKAEAIESLQNATIDQTAAIDSLSDALSVFFNYQQKLSSAIKFLFLLGMQNAASARTVVRKITMHLKHASEEEIDEMERAELNAVLQQIKAFVDIHDRLETLAKYHKQLEQSFTDFKQQVEQKEEEFKTEVAGALEKNHRQSEQNFIDFRREVEQKEEDFKKKIEEKLEEIYRQVEQKTTSEQMLDASIKVKWNE